MSDSDQDSAPRDRLAWKFHNHRVEHRGGTHETPNGARGANCSGPDPVDYKAADEVLYGDE